MCARGVPVRVESRVRLRFKRLGRKKQAFFRIVAIDSKRPREGVQLEEVGWYNPRTGEANLKGPSIKYWLNTGAVPSESVRGLLRKALLLKEQSQQSDE